MKFSKALLVLPLLLLYTGCASAPPPKEAVCPEWTTKGDAAFPESTDLFYGVGSADNISNISLLRKTSDSRAINEIAQQLNVSSKSMVEDYMNSVSAAGGEASEQSVTQGIKTVVEKSLVGVKIIDRCHDKEAGIHYSLAKFSMSNMEKIINEDRSIDPKLKEYVKENANRFFEKMDK
ncbi:MAG: LPP20 family lipoprotein [Nitrospinota bacterium]|nr:LPP20 family lipoprotein [Nitrospinota bacterium]